MNVIIDKIKQKPRSFLSLLSLSIFFIAGIIYLSSDSKDIIGNIIIIDLIFLGVVILSGIYDFIKSEKRMQHQFTSFHASSALSGFYRVYFPIIIVSFIVQIGVGISFINGSLDSSVTSTGLIAIIASTIIVGVGITVLVDSDLRQKRIRLTPRGDKNSFLRSLVYVLPLMGLYYGFTFLMRFLVIQLVGPVALYPTTTDFFRLDGLINETARFWTFLTKKEKFLVPIAYISLYIGIEFLLRGLIGNEARTNGLGAGGIVFVPAIIQATAFSSGNLIFTDPIYYMINLLDALFLGIILGITLWRTKRFSTTVFVAITVRMLDTTLDFHDVILNSFPRALGVYDPADNIVSTIDKIGDFMIFFQILLVLLAPFIMLVNYDETLRVLSQLKDSLKNQWFGYIILGFAFFLIDLIFSYFMSFSTGIGGIILAYVLSLLVIGISLNYLFKLLPPITDFSQLRQDGEDNEFPINVVEDIRYLETSDKWYSHPKLILLLSGGFYLYIIFISAAYRQYNVLTGIESIKFIIFLVFLPTLLMAISGYLISRAILRGYFFADDWRKSFLTFLVILYFFNLYTWSISTAITIFSWRNIPFFIASVLLIFSKPNRVPLSNYTTGLSTDGRYATFKNILYDPDPFRKEFENLLTIPKDNVQIGARIAAAKLGLLNEWEEITELQQTQDIGEKIGSIFVLGLIGSKSSEGILLKFLEDENTHVRIAAYWSLGRIAGPNVLNRMVQLLEENPKKELVPIAEQAIHRIDPNFPLAGIRDNITIET